MLHNIIYSLIVLSCLQIDADTDEERITPLASGRRFSLPSIKLDKTDSYTRQARNISGHDSVQFNSFVSLNVASSLLFSRNPLNHESVQ